MAYCPSRWRTWQHLFWRWFQVQRTNKLTKVNSEQAKFASRILGYSKAVLILLLLGESVVRMAMGRKYWTSGCVVDIVVTAMCATGEVLGFVGMRFVRIDVFLMGFRLWHALRIIRSTSLRLLKCEERALAREEGWLAMGQQSLDRHTLQSSQMEEDLRHMRQILARYKERRDRAERDQMDTSASSWHAIVPRQVSLKLRDPVLKRALSAPILHRKPSITPP